MNEMELLVDLHRHTNRQGPGSQEDTIRALSFVDFHNNTELNTADIGCGTGGQTLTLAGQIGGKITAVDLFPQFLEELETRAIEVGISDRIITHAGSMDRLPFQKESLDLILSEGAVYIMGFEKGIKAWNHYLKKGGYLAVTEITWITNERPNEVEAFWADQYAHMGTASQKIQELEKSGYNLVGYFNLKPSSWLDNYYRPLEKQIPEFLERHAHSELAVNVVKEHRDEMAFFEKYSEYYSYGFYIARKN